MASTATRRKKPPLRPPFFRRRPMRCKSVSLRVHCSLFSSFPPLTYLLSSPLSLSSFLLCPSRALSTSQRHISFPTFHFHCFFSYLATTERSLINDANKQNKASKAGEGATTKTERESRCGCPRVVEIRFGKVVHCPHSREISIGPVSYLEPSDNAKRIICLA